MIYIGGMQMLTLVDNLKEANAVTHGGSFHADDVFSSVFLSKMHDIKLYRTNEIKETDDVTNKIVFDIGYQEFDHHGPNARIRENGIKYSSFGLLFERFGRSYLNQKGMEEVEECYQLFLREFVLQIDALDNGIFPPSPKDYTITTMSYVIELFNKTWKENANNNENFYKAYQIAELIFDRIEKRIIDKLSAKKIVEKAIEESQNNILYLEEYMPFMDFVLTSQNEKAKSIFFAIFPSNRGGYNIRAINQEIGNHKNRVDFPTEWGGKTKEELEKLTNIKSFRFCHTNLFLCTTDTLEDAYRVANLAIQKK